MHSSAMSVRASTPSLSPAPAADVSTSAGRSSPVISSRSSSPTFVAAIAAASAARASAIVAASVRSVYRSPLTSRPLVRTLSALLAALVGMQVSTELKSDWWVRGTLEAVDPRGNMRFTQATMQRASGMSHGKQSSSVSAPLLSNLFVPGRSVRYVVLPSGVDGRRALESHESRMDDRLAQYKRKKRSGKYITREEQEKAVTKKQRKLDEEMKTKDMEGPLDEDMLHHEGNKKPTIIIRSSAVQPRSSTPIPGATISPASRSSDSPSSSGPSAKRQRTAASVPLSSASSSIPTHATFASVLPPDPTPTPTPTPIPLHSHQASHGTHIHRRSGSRGSRGGGRGRGSSNVVPKQDAANSSDQPTFTIRMLP